MAQRNKGSLGMAPEPDAQGSPACVLVVEDEVLVRVLIADELRDAGFLVLEAATGDKAWSYVQAGVQVDLVISDIGLPGSLNGVDLVGRLALRRPICRPC